MLATPNILSVDVEELFHSEYVRRTLFTSRNTALNYRTPENIFEVLDLLQRYNCRATFFIVGEIAERYPYILYEIERHGHEIAFHGRDHKPLWELDSQAFREELEGFKRIYPSCIGFRAPSFSLNNDTKWCMDILVDEHFKYDSSIFPTMALLYTAYRAPTHPYRPSKDDVFAQGSDNYNIIEFPLTVYKLGFLKIPAAGGFWLRVFGPSFVGKAIRKLNKEGFPAVIYIHNWELDLSTPKLEIGFLKGFITYHNIKKTRMFFEKLLKEFHFISFKEFLETNTLD